MKIIKIITLSFLVLCLTVTSAMADQSMWTGAYDYEEDLGDGMFIGHTIQVMMRHWFSLIHL